HADASGAAFRNEYVAVRRGADEPRRREPGGKQIDGKVGGNARFLVGAVRDSDRVGDRAGGLRPRQVGRPNKPARPWRVGTPVAKRGVTFQNAAAGLRQNRRGYDTE